jgi:hypothetical protein
MAVELAAVVEDVDIRSATVDAAEGCVELVSARARGGKAVNAELTARTRVEGCGMDRKVDTVLASVDRVIGGVVDVGWGAKGIHHRMEPDLDAEAIRTRLIIERQGTPRAWRKSHSSRCRWHWIRKNHWRYRRWSPGQLRCYRQAQPGKPLHGESCFRMISPPCKFAFCFAFLFVYRLPVATMFTRGLGHLGRIGSSGSA